MNFQRRNFEGNHSGKLFKRLSQRKVLLFFFFLSKRKQTSREILRAIYIFLHSWQNSEEHQERISGGFSFFSQENHTEKLLRKVSRTNSGIFFFQRHLKESWKNLGDSLKGIFGQNSLGIFVNNLKILDKSFLRIQRGMPGEKFVEILWLMFGEISIRVAGEFLK